jgi:chromosome segregation protein
MRLEKIKLSGFKSFVDPTTVPITGNLTAIVGPNGCGKSNIIDAVRWVMGESSAKHLRGGIMTDVIFNGSSTRKPISTASVELVFDNSEGKAGGEFAQYSTISIKRQVNRDAQSLYHLNGTRCRRKDVTDLFLGTGLGARSYAIIEQGTISRMVEAKPEELRGHIEEAAGISKYKERRQETETRMRHTRENLERLDDLREEVDKQLQHLKKQAEKAEKYTELKQQERQYKLELLAMRWNAYHQSSLALQEKLQAVAEEHNRLFSFVREFDSQTDAKRAEHKRQQEQLNIAQGDFYNAVADVSRLEQAIKHNESSHAETIQEIERLQQQAEESVIELEQDSEQLEQIKQSLQETDTALVTAREDEQLAVQNQQEFLEKRALWQEQWEEYRNQTAKFKEQTEVSRSQITQLENQNRQLQIRMQRLQTEQSELSGSQLQLEIEALDHTIEEIEQARTELYQQLEQLHQSIRECRQQVKQYHDELHQYRSELHSVRGKITSLELLQQHAMGKDNKKLGQWLQQMQISNQQRLAEFLDVEAGWETAVETVLGTYLEAICIDDAEALLGSLDTLTDESLTLFETRAQSDHLQPGILPRLEEKISSQWNLTGLLSAIYCAADIESARAFSSQLRDYESIITPEGVWMGPGWLRISRASDSKTGVLQREKELRSLKQRQIEIQDDILLLEQKLDVTDTALKDAESQRESLQQQDKILAAEFSAKSSEFSAHSVRHEQQQRRLSQVCDEMDDITRETAENAESLAEAELLKQEAELSLAEMEIKRQELDMTSQELQVQQQQAEQTANAARHQVHTLQTQLESLKSSEILTAKQLQRLQQQHQQSVARIAQLEQKLQQTLTPLDDEKLQLTKLIETKEQLEAVLKKQRQELENSEAELTHLAEQHTRTQRELERQKEALDKIRFEQQESDVRQQTVNEQLNEIDADAEQVLTTLPEDAEASQWKQTVEKLTGRIERLGTINLTAIEEFQAQSERKNFLDEQHQDLENSLAVLDQAINKIDKESRLRFKDTFDKINSGLQEKFPKLFGGGQAYLQLTDQDLLESGVNIIARPPGKKNSSIHLLSGGEKALTAVALVFSIFELNPAPFCLLDEVDAPLDDANVGRFSKLVEEMSESVQFLYISHNKVTMEIAKQLAGVTMKEPGVSRMVAVDIEDAVNLAETNG